MAAADRFAAAALAGALLFGLARDASAFCVATTCDSKNEPCATKDRCVVEGAPLHWESRCLSFAVQRDGSPLRHISYQSADTIIRSAFQQWLNADCGGGKHPSFQMWDIAAAHGGMVCDTPEFNSTKPNANVWMFRDHDWPYGKKDATLALTSTIFEKSTGALLDADVEINSFANVLTTTSVSNEVGRDLQSIVTHEAGHFLGLGHSQFAQATMYAEYSAGDLNYRSLHVDDVAAICSVYPPDRDSGKCSEPSPPHGFSLYCGGGDDDGTASVTGCSCATPGGEGSRPLPELIVAALAAMAFARRRRV